MIRTLTLYDSWGRTHFHLASLEWTFSIKSSQCSTLYWFLLNSQTFNSCFSSLNILWQCRWVLFRTWPQCLCFFYSLVWLMKPSHRFSRVFCTAWSSCFFLIITVMSSASAESLRVSGLVLSLINSPVRFFLKSHNKGSIARLYKWPDIRQPCQERNGERERERKWSDSEESMWKHV